jgi:hypothetical protein
MKGQYYSRFIKVMIFVIDFFFIYLAFLITNKVGDVNTKYRQSIRHLLATCNNH